ncbi:sodium/proline symporter PutP [Sulfurovum sp. XGS-02]|uniref:sodium/proline symporter PutP n=1 Tax=Sulfurovum sp. XGS-02 TaxID=2925411 RepID=UPI002044F643|nr:sodium/proline symporter PutP [Sulfurovum sp. XGS-02]UPT78298.1 sodium/proline symporter PutP [Sulfurovum sp. XGS-02]
MQIEIIISFIGYMLVMLAIGFYFYFKTNDLSDYVLGGRGLNPSVTALSAGASDMSGWLLLGLPGMMYSDGIVGSWIAVGLIAGAYLNWHYVAKPLRVYTHHLNDSITIPDYLANRFEDNGHILRVVTAVVILIFYTLYTSSGLVGGAKLFEATFNITYSDALLIGSFVIVSYTFLGGYNAVSWTDFIQGILMMLALVITPIVVVSELGGITSAVTAIASLEPSHLNMVSGVSLISVISLLAWGLGYFGQPHILVRFMSIRDENETHKAKTIGMSWMILSIIGSLSVGFFGFAYVAANSIDLADSEKIFILLSQLVFNPWIAGFLLAAILAAIMSTIDSQLLVSSSVLTRDVYHAILHKEASDKELVWIGRATVILIAVIAWYLSTDENSSVLKLVSYAWAGFGAAFGPLIILSLYSRNITKFGAIAGMVVGALTVIIWKELEGGVFEIFELLPGFVFSWIAILLFSRYGAANPDSISEKFDEVQSRLKYT